MEQEHLADSRLKIRNFIGPLNDANESETEGGLFERKWKDLHFDFSPGDVIIIRGASGTGKSTLLKKVANLFSVEPSHESSSSLIELDSRPVLGQNDKDRRPIYQSNLYRSRIGYVAQRPALFAGSPFDLYQLLSGVQVYKKKSSGRRTRSTDLEANLDLSNGLEDPINFSSGPGWRMYTAKGIESLIDGNLDEEQNSIIINHDPLIDLPVHNFEALAFAWGIEKKKLTTPWSKLSGGEAQRVALALAIHMRFIHRDPNSKGFEKGDWVAFLLDEPTSALDDDSCMVIENGMIRGRAMQDVAILWITHSDAQADRIENSLLELNKANPLRKRLCRTLHLGVS